MNREIKFRAWNKEKNIMVYNNEDDTYGYWDGCRNSNVGMVNEILNSKYYEEYEFMQFTGLHDKTGKKYMNGDIVKIEYKDMKFKGLVKYDETYLAYVIISTNTTKHEFENLGDYLDYDIEVIGNVTDSPELLGGE